jgi:hypothetical protein
MNVSELLADLESRGVVLSENEAGTGLRIDAPPGALSPDLRGQIVAQKSELRDLLFEREERAALMGAPEWMDARTFLEAVDDPNVRAVLKTFQAEIVGVYTAGGRREAA